MRHFVNLALAAALILGAAAPARAGAVQIGSTFDVENTNFVDTFNQAVTFTGTGQNTSIDGGKLLVNEKVVPTGSRGAWIVFNLSTANGGPLAGNSSAKWEAAIENIHFTTDYVVDDHFASFSLNGVPFSNLKSADHGDRRSTGVRQDHGCAQVHRRVLRGLRPVYLHKGV
jgi:hypothetical protein